MFILFNILETEYDVESNVTKIDQNLFSVNSRSEKQKLYLVDMTTGLCECFIAKDGSPCWHQFCLWSSGLATCPNFLPHFDKAERQKFAEIAIGASLESSYYDTLHSFVGKDENIILAAPLMASHNASSEKQPCEDFIAHSKEINCTMDEVSQEFDKF